MQQFVTMINPFSGSMGGDRGGAMSFAGDALGYAAANSRDAQDARGLCRRDAAGCACIAE